MNNNKDGGFIKLIILILLALLVVKYYGLNVSEIIGWIKSFFGGIFR